MIKFYFVGVTLLGPYVSYVRGGGLILSVSKRVLPSQNIYS